MIRVTKGMDLQIQGITQCFNKTNIAIDDLTLHLRPGVTGLLGPNGAGKSSLMRLLATIVSPSSGDILLEGKSIFTKNSHYRSMLGYLPQYFGVYENLSATEFLNYIAAIKGIDRKTAQIDIEKCLNRLNLSEVANQAMSTYSGGMRQRVGIAQALLDSPKIVIFDEPTVGLDPDERARFRDILVEISDNSIVLLSTHIVSDVESIADQIAIMQSGKLAAYGDCQSLLSKIENKVWQCQIEPTEMTLFKSKFQVTYSIRKNDKLQVRVLSDTAPTANAKLESPSLEDAFAFYASNRS